MDNIVELIKALVWPLTVFFLVIILRKEIGGTFSRLSQFKYKDFEAKFGRELAKAEENSEGLSSMAEESAEDASEVTSNFTDYEKFMEIAVIDPRAAIASAWFEVEYALGDLMKATGSVIGKTSPSAILRRLVDEGTVSGDVLTVYDDLRVLRNRAVHSPDFSLGIGEVERYVGLVHRLAAAFREIVRNIRKDSDSN